MRISQTASQETTQIDKQNKSPPNPTINPIIRLLNIGVMAGAMFPVLLLVIINLRYDRPSGIAAPRRRSLLEEPVPGPERAEHARAAHRPEHPGAAHPAPERLGEERVVERVPAPEQAGHRSPERPETPGAKSGELAARAEGVVPSVPPSLHFPVIYTHAASSCGHSENN
jgi:hypothetical protein